MNIWWHNGGLRLDAETAEERQALEALVNSHYRIGEPAIKLGEDGEPAVEATDEMRLSTSPSSRP
jgi:hypothetical protein